MATTQPIEVPFQEVIQDRLPDLIESQNRTSSMSVSNTHYVGPFKEWTTFEEEVRTNSLQYTTSHQAELAEIMMYQQPTGVHSFGDELVVCGNEIGVSGRFTQHLGQVMSCVAQQLHIRLVFGDWRHPISDGTQMSKKMPDVCFMDASHVPRIVGELKTPWTVSLDRSLRIGAHMGGEFRHLTGQLSNYMNNSGLKYGFISTYAQTIFFKEDLCDEERTGLSYSRVIYHDTTSGGGVPTAGNNLVGQVSLRECMLYLLRLASQNNEAWRSLGKKAYWNKKSVPLRFSEGLPENGVTFTQSPRQSGGMSGHSSQGGAGSSSSHRVRGADHKGPRDVHGAVRVRLREGQYWHLLHNNTPEPVEDYIWKNGRLQVRVDSRPQFAVVDEEAPMKKLTDENPRDVHGAVRVKLQGGQYWHLLHNNTPEPVEDYIWKNGRLQVKVDGRPQFAVVDEEAPMKKLTDENPRDVHGAVRVKLQGGQYWHLLHNNTPEPVEDHIWKNGRLQVKVDGRPQFAVIDEDGPTQSLIPDSRPPSRKWHHRLLAV